MNWSGKTILITGASSGIGEVTARRLAVDGARLLLVARREERLAALVEAIERQGGRAVALRADLSLETERMALAERVLADYGCPDVLINNAGLGWFGWYAEMNWEVTRSLLRVNIEAVAHLTRLFLPGMLARRSGHIVNVGSIVCGLPEHGVVVYSASKAFVANFSTALYRELAGSGVRVSEVRPGPVSTEFFDAAEQLEKGGRIPGEFFSTTPERVAGCIWNVLQHPRRVAYVPWWLRLSPALETFFGWAIDWAGPVLLPRDRSKPG